MFQGNWKCSKCGGAITELPFEPRSESNLTCRDCYSGSKGASSAGATGVGESGGEAAAPNSRPMHEGNWKCSGCGNAITSLPFAPRNTDNLKCIDCFKASR